MSVGTRILIILSALIAVTVGLNHVLLRQVVYPRFEELEADEARKDMDRCVAALRREVETLEGTCHDWAAWDDTHRFMTDGDKEYVESNLLAEAFTDNGLNAILLYDLAGKLVAGETRDLAEDKAVEIAEFPRAGLPADHPLLRHPGPDSEISGVISTSRGPMVISSHPIITSAHAGPIRGTMILGWLLTPDRVARIRKQVSVAFDLWELGTGSEPGEEADAPAGAKAADEHVIRRNGQRLRVYAAYPDVTGEPLLLLRAGIPRHITAKGKASLRFAALSMALLGLLVLVTLMVLLRRTVIRPLAALTEHVTSVGRSHDLTARMSVRHGGEIGRLAGEFDRMLERLETSHRRLQENERRLRTLASELSLSEERQRKEIASALHEGIGQRLFAITTNLAVLRKLDCAKDHMDVFDEITALADRAIRDARSLTFELCPPVLYQVGLLAAARWLAETFEGRYGISCELSVPDDEIPLCEDIRGLLYQGVRELVINVAKHAQCRTARVAIRPDDDAVHVTVADDGVGFEPDGLARGDGDGGGFGLFSIRERFLAVGGQVHVHSRPGAGCRVELVVPLCEKHRGCRGRTQ